MKIRKNDNVLVIAGKDRGKKGKVRFVYPREDRLIVEGVNFIKKHARATRSGQAGGHNRARSANSSGRRHASVQQVQPSSQSRFSSLTGWQKGSHLPRLRRGN